MASTINASTAGVGGVITTADNTGILNIQTAGTTAITVNASQNVGVGVTPSAWSSIKALQVVNASFGGLGNGNYSASNAYYDGANWKYIASNYATLYQQSGNAGDGTHKWSIAASGTAGNAISFTQAMTLDASGNLLVGTTSGTERVTAAGTNANWMYSSNSTGSGTFYHFIFKSNGTQTGTITSTSTTATYGTSSDYRLKENIAPMTGALDKVALLKPVTYNWKLDGSDGQGFIAHELAEVCPDAVQGEKDAVDAEGNPVYQGIDTSFLVATLTAAIQEQQALIENLTTRLSALENK
jgi:hypothetical protein